MTVTEDRQTLVDEAPPPVGPTSVLTLIGLRTTDPGTVGVRTRRRIPRGVERLLGVVAVLLVWQLAATLGWIDERSLAGPLDVTSTFWEMLTDGTLTSAMWSSLQRVLIGIAIGVPVAVLLALFSGLSRIGEDLTDAPMHMFRFIPIIALQPLLVLWLGIGESVKISLIVLGVIFPVYVNTSNAIRSIDPKNLELAHTVGLGRWATVRRVVLPAALPSFLVGFRLATSVAWLLLVFAEQINAKSGIGYLVIKAQTFFQSDVMVVCLLVYAVLGLLSDFGVRTLERRLLRWQPGR